MANLLIIILMAVVAVMWNRQQVLTRRVDELEDEQLYPGARSGTATPLSEPARATATVRSAAMSDTAPDTATKEPVSPWAAQDDGQPQELPGTEDAPTFDIADETPAPDWEEPAPASEYEPGSDPIEESGENFVTAKRRFDIEDIFGRRLPIWVGGITLAIAGILLVRYSIEAGLVTPSVRVALAFVFGFALIAGAEWAYRKAIFVNDPRICQALAGAGLATLYAGFYLAGSQYGLIGQTFAFLGLAAVTAGAIGLSFRFGLPCAVLGLVGGFAAPLLVGGEEANLPVLTIYLGLVTVGLTQAGQRQGRSWLSVAALAVGLGWGFLLLLSSTIGTAEILALGFYLLLLGAVLPTLFTDGSFVRPVRFASAFVASLQLAILVEKAGDGVLAWALYLLMGATLAALGWRRSELREASIVATAIAVALVALWDPAIDATFYAIVAIVAVIFVAVPLLHLWRGSANIIDRMQLAGGAFGLAAAVYAVIGQPADDLRETIPAIIAFAMAAFPAIGAWRDRATADQSDWAAIFTATSAALVLGGGLLLTASWAAPLVAALVFGAVMALTLRRDDRPTRWLLIGASIVVAFSLLASIGGHLAELERLVEGSDGTLNIQSILRWLAVTATLVAIAWRMRSGRAFVFAQIGGAIFGYGLLAQALPDEVLVWACALIVIALRFAPFAARAAQITLCAVIALWALLPAAQWLGTGLSALAGEGPLLFRWPALSDVLLRLLPLAPALAALRIPSAEFHSTVDWMAHVKRIPLYVSAAIAVVILHLLFKQIFAIETQTAFTAMALAERTVWQALLLGAAFIATRPLPRIGAQPILATGLACASLAHLIWFTGVMHNPLFQAQAVGPIPIANLALAVAAVGLFAIWLLRAKASLRIQQALDGLAMGLIVVSAITLLRQVFAGSILPHTPLGQSEDLLRSLIGIILAIAFLLIGRKSGEQSWRIGSLVVMVLAVAKVFLVDAAALEGLLRIASFMALGFSLLGIGWLYARQLGPVKTGEPIKG